MSLPKISVCIPAYEMHGEGAGFLSASFSALESQTLKNFEVVVSDQSVDTAVKEVCTNWSDRLNIRHISNWGGKRQASANVNFALDAAKAPIHKILFQDDFLCSPDALKQIFDAFTASSAKWLLSGSGVLRDGTHLERPMVPVLNPKMHFGKNTVSSPSVLALSHDCNTRFDENLIWLMDVEMYKRLWDTYGDPIILPGIHVANRLHAGQASVAVDRSRQKLDLDYVWKQHAATTNLSGKIEYLKRRLKTILAN